MHIKIFDKTSNIKTSAIYLSYRILRYFSDNKKNQESIYKLIRNINTWENGSYKQLSYALIFLHSCDLVDFNAPYVILKDKSKLF